MEEFRQLFRATGFPSFSAYARWCVLEGDLRTEKSIVNMLGRVSRGAGLMSPTLRLNLLLTARIWELEKRSKGT